MRGGLVASVLVAGCSQALPPKVTEPPAPTTPVVLEVPRAQFSVVPAELADPHVLDRIRHRVVVTQWKLAWWDRDGSPIGTEAQEPATGADIMGVIGEDTRRIRIVVDDDGARVAAWIPRDDVAATALVPQQLSDDHGAATPQWIVPGVSAIAKQRDGALRKLEIIDPILATEGWARTKLVGNVWVAPPADKLPEDLRKGRHPTWSPPADGKAMVWIEAGTKIRATPDPASRVLATIKGDSEIAVAVVGRKPAITEVEAHRPFIRVRGFIDNAQILGPADHFRINGTGSGHGFGMSHTSQHEVPAGTCLYNKADGDVVGVTLQAQTRLGGPLGDNGWALVYINTPWAISSLFLKNVAPAADPASPPVWDSCTEPAHRR